MDVDLNGRKIDVAKALPLVVKDWKALHRVGITPQRLTKPAEDFEAVVGYALYVLQKADPAVDKDALENLTVPQMMHIVKQINDAETAAADADPFSPSTIPSP